MQLGVQLFVLQGLLANLDHIEQDIRIFHGTPHKIHHGFLQRIGGLDDSWGIRNHDLKVVSIQKPQNPVTRRLRLGSDDGQAFAHQGIHQGRFAHIGVSDNVDKTRFMRHFFLRLLKYSLAALLTLGESNKTAIMFGITIKA